MKNIKSHFWYSKSQRNGVLYLVIIIVLLQIGYFSLDYFYQSDDSSFSTSIETLLLQSKIDSLKKVKADSKAKIYPFNPNFISDYKGYKLGMSVNEIDRLHQFRNKNKYVNSKEEFQNITKVSDSLLNVISPYFKFPDWVLKKKTKQKKVAFKKQESLEKIKITTNDINMASAEDFKAINGIGEVLSKRIINYRKRLQGFSYPSQLNEVWGLDTEIALKATKVFEVKVKPIISKVNINTASFKEVLKTPYVDYELCKKIFSYRDEFAELRDISELKKIDGFPIDKYDRIVLYLEAK